MGQRETATILSNQLELLYDHLKADLSQELDPYCERVIVVKTKAAKSYLQRKLSCELEQKVICGMKILLIEEFLENLLSLSFPALEVQIEIDRILGEQITATLSQTLTETMKKWAYTGFKEINTPKTHYQKIASQVWHSLVQKERFAFPAPLLQSGAYTDKINQKKKKKISLFGISALPQLLHTFFVKLATIFEVHNYFLSPCMLFWSDIVSDRQVEVEKNEQLAELLLDRNSLLANNGKIGREFAALLEESFPHAKQEYTIGKDVKMRPEFSEFIRLDILEEENSENSLLECVQADILLLCGKRKDKIFIAKEDTSIEIHNAPTPLREIEQLYERLLLVTKKEAEKNRALLPCDILVLAPDIERYIPYIERVFGASSSPFSYQIIDQRIPWKKNRLLETFFVLLDLPQRRFGVDAFAELFYCKSFARKQGIEEEELATIANFFATSSFRWGFDAKQRHKLFSDEGFTESSFAEKASFKEAYDKFACSWQGEESAPCIAKALFSCRTLFNDFSFLSLRSLTLVQGVEFLESLLTSYFQIDFEVQEERKEYDLLQEALAHLRKSITGASNYQVPFSQLRGYLESALRAICEKKERFLHKEIIFATLGATAPLTAKHLALIGLEAHEFPRKESRDEDRYLFIEALLSTRGTLTLSYQGFSFETETKNEPSPVVQDLLKAIHEGYELEGAVTHSHPLVKPRQQIPSEKKDFLYQSQKAESDNVVDLKFLREVAKTPLKAYFQSAYGLFLSSYDEEKPKAKESGMALKKYDLRKLEARSLEVSQETFLQEIEEHPRMPVHKLLKKAMSRHLAVTQEELAVTAKAFGIAGEKPLSVELAITCKAPVQVSSELLLVPAVCFEIENRKVILTGRVDALYTAGSAIFERESRQAIFRIWPDILLRAYLMEEYKLFDKNAALFLKDGKVKPIYIQNPLASLKEFVTYALNCKERPSCLYPHLIESLLKADQDRASIKAPYEELYLELFLQRATDGDFEKLFPEWQKNASLLYAAFYEGP